MNLSTEVLHTDRGCDLRRRRYGCTDCVKKIQKQTVADIPFVNGAVRCIEYFTSLILEKFRVCVGGITADIL